MDTFIFCTFIVFFLFIEFFFVHTSIFKSKKYVFCSDEFKFFVKKKMITCFKKLSIKLSAFHHSLPIHLYKFFKYFSLLIRFFWSCCSSGQKVFKNIIELFILILSSKYFGEENRRFCFLVESGIFWSFQGLSPFLIFFRKKCSAFSPLCF